MEEYEPDDDPEETELVKYEDQGALSHFKFLSEEQGVLAKVTEYQRSLITGEIPVEKTKAVVFKSGDSYIYIPVGFYIDALNKLFGIGGWKLIVDKRDLAQVPFSRKWEARVEGRLVAEQYGVEVWGDGANLLKERDQQTVGDAYKAAKSDMLKQCCQWIGLALGLKDDKYVEKVKHYHGIQKKPKNFNDLRGALGDCKLGEVREKLDESGVEWEEWELESAERVEHIVRELKVRK